jgi:superfamily I DNA/RNA helicase
MNLYDIIKSDNLKLFSPFIEGGTSKLKKDEIIKVGNIMKNYKKNEKIFIFDDQEINLDDDQYTVVTSKPNQNIRILAGAGSGKTTTILCRVKYLVDNFTTPNRILILTFNKDSSENLKKRITKLFEFKINIDIYTIDAFCCLLYHKFHKQKAYISLSEYVLIGRKLMMEYGSEISSKYSYVFFDEFQDVNSKQFDILNEFVKNGCYLTVIGDDAQNIYQFRGTDNYFIINFDNIFNNCSTYTLTTNYRSSQLIVNLANNIINFNENQVKKIMKTYNEKGFRPKFILSQSEDDQIEFIIGKINRLIEDGVNLDEIVILSRNSYHLKIMETELIKHNIPLVSCITDKIGDNIKKILEPDKVAVTTIHKSKGLEWSYVFILGFCNQHFPSHMNNNIKNIEEERRLFYVGITRAKNRLYLMSSHSEIPISCFIKENLDYIKIVYYPKKSKPSFDIFKTQEDNTIKQEYSVNDIVLLLNTEVIDEMRTNNFIIDFDIDCFDLISSLDLDNKIEFSEEIKKGAYEADFGEFVDRYITRQLIINKNVNFKDNDTMIILNAIILSIYLYVAIVIMIDED